MKKIEWKDINELSESEITYLLYLEGKDIRTISRIRNAEKPIIEKQIIECKIKYRAFEGAQSPEDLAKKLIRYGRDERQRVIFQMTEEEKLKLEKHARNMLFKSNREECSFYIWLLGEFKSKDSLSSIITFLKCSDGNVKRICCSALGKIGSPEAEEALIGCLNDKKPQVRQYAIKALEKINSMNALDKLREICQDGAEKDYVVRAAKNAIEQILGKVI